MTLLAVVYVLAVYRLTRLVVSDTFPPVRALRERVLARWPSEDTEFTGEWVTHTAGEPTTPTGTALYPVDSTTYAALYPHWIGELVTCAWCASVWVAALALPFFWAFPDVMVWVGLIPAASGITGLLASKE